MVAGTWQGEEFCGIAVRFRLDWVVGLCNNDVRVSGKRKERCSRLFCADSDVCRYFSCDRDGSPEKPGLAQVDERTDPRREGEHVKVV